MAKSSFGLDMFVSGISIWWVAKAPTLCHLIPLNIFNIWTSPRVMAVYNMRFRARHHPLPHNFIRFSCQENTFNIQVGALNYYSTSIVHLHYLFPYTVKITDVNIFSPIKFRCCYLISLWLMYICPKENFLWIMNWSKSFLNIRWWKIFISHLFLLHKFFAPKSQSYHLLICF